MVMIESWFYSLIIITLLVAQYKFTPVDALYIQMVIFMVYTQCQEILSKLNIWPTISTRHVMQATVSLDSKMNMRYLLIFSVSIVAASPNSEWEIYSRLWRWLYDLVTDDASPFAWWTSNRLRIGTISQKTSHRLVKDVLASQDFST